MEKIIFDKKRFKFIFLDSNNKIINDDKKLLGGFDQNKIKDIDFNNLPSNVLDNIPLYLGKEYEVYNVILNDIIGICVNISYDVDNNKLISKVTFK